MTDFLADDYWTSSEENVLACTASSWAGDPTKCRWCDGPFAPPRRRWCSEQCASAFFANHYWTAASARRRRLDKYVCQRCSRGQKDEQGEYERDRKGRILRFQVHHKTPVLGRHGKGGCHHHIDGLETLCADCHHDEHHPPKPAKPEQLTF